MTSTSIYNSYTYAGILILLFHIESHVNLVLQSTFVKGPLITGRTSGPVSQRCMATDVPGSRGIGGKVLLVLGIPTAGLAATQVDPVRQVLPEVVTTPIDNVLKPVYELVGVTPPSPPGAGQIVKPVPKPEKSSDPLQEKGLARVIKVETNKESQPAITKKEESKPAPVVSTKSEAPKSAPPVVKKEEQKVTKTVKEEPKKVMTDKVETKKSDPKPAPEATAATVAMGTVAKAVSDKEKAEKEQKQIQEEKAAKNTALEKQINNLLEGVSKSKSDALAAMEKMVESTKQHTEALKKAIEAEGKSDKDSQWKAVSETYKLRQKAEELSNKIVNEARTEIDKVRQVVSEAQTDNLTKDNKSLIRTLETLDKTQDELKIAGSKVVKSIEESSAMQRVKEMVEEGKKQFRKELDSIMPELKLADKEKLSEEDLNTLLAHAHKKIEQLQSQLAKSVGLEKEKVKEAMERQRQQDERLLQQKVKSEAEKIRKAYMAEKLKWDENTRVQFEDEMRHVLARQAAAHSEHLKEALLHQEKELDVQMEKKLVMEMLEQRQKFQEEVAGWLARLKGIEKAVTDRAEADKFTQKAKQLWVASVAMSSIVQNGREDKLVWEEKLQPLANEIVSIADASFNHPFISIVLSTIPEEAYLRGVWTEDTLKQRFRKVQNVCKKVALIQDTNSSLMQYFMSYLASYVIHPRISAKKESEEVDIASMDNYDILANAQYWIDEGRFEVAVRYMNQLSGESRQVASDWLKEAKIFLETKQAANALVAFAAAGGLGTMV
ncbi:hypothetical protein FSP39_002946 [Pinctada imbricata]|uniref:MICOS complex subunit MIC60 n=1 Tax=Pinctada imbricata TaxID=66713 RepID=A0AA89BTY4_PINIB|nr:hypothetical protein FSP39_002946 [Pinctada imbricata]